MKKSFLSAVFFLAFRLRPDFGGLTCLRAKSALRRAIPAIALAAAGLLHPVSSSAQSPVNVTATVVDPSGIPYANATVSILLLPVGGATVGGNQILTTNNGLLDSNGKLNVSLYKNSDISPGGSTWQFTICETPGIAPPLGTGGVCFTSAQTVSAAVDFSTQFQAAAKVLTTIPVSTNFPSINKILFVGPSAGQYPSLQAAHDALPTAGGTVFVMGNATPFGAGTTNLSISKPIRVIGDIGTFTYTGTGQAILCTSVNAPIIEGSGFQGGGSAGGTIFSVTNTTANGFDINTCPGAQIRNLNIIGPGSGTGKGLIYTGNSGVVENVVVKSFGGNGCEEDGTRGNSNGVRWFGVRCVSNGGIGLNVFGANANLNKFEEVEVSSNTGLGAQIATATNILDPLHSFSNNSGGVGVSFISGASQNRGTLYSDLGTQTTDLAEAVGANNNKIGFLSGQNYTDAGTNNASEMPRSLAPTASAATPSYSFQASNTTGFYDGGGGAVVFSSGGTAIELFSSTTHRLGSAKCFGWSSNADPTAAGNDAGICRESPNVVDCGNGTAADKSCQLNLATVSPVSTTVAALPAAAAGNKGWIKSVSDSTAVAAEGQTCVGGSTNTALAFSNGTVWKCF